MKIFGFTGFSGSGKTELILKLIQHFHEKNISVATIKHAHHAFDIDKKGKDSYRYREVGATQTIISSAKRWAMMHENTNDSEAELPFLLQQLQPADIILIEGYKNMPHPKLEVWRSDSGNESVALSDANIPNILAMAVPTKDMQAIKGDLTLLALDDIPRIADFVMEFAHEQ